MDQAAKTRRAPDPFAHLDMDPLPQYSSHEFISYLSSNPSSSESTTPLTSSPLSSEDIPLRDLSPPTSTLPPLALRNTSTWTYCGPLLPLEPAALPPSFHAWSETTINGSLLPRLLPFLRYLNSFLRDAGAEHYWFTLRATKPTNEYDTVRWHTDDIFFDYDGDEERRRDRNRGGKRKGYWKLATTLLGPSTLFLKDDTAARRKQRDAKQAESEKRGDHTCASMRCLGCLEAVESVRHRLARDLADDEVESPRYGEVAFFRLGDEEGAVHSEPPCHEDRIFVNVVPGSKDELSSLMARWGLSYPRAWCFGVPVAFEDYQESESAAPASSRAVRAESPIEEHELKLDNCDKGVDGKDWSPSTMSLNLRDEYQEWLKKKGFQFAHVFGQSRASIMGNE